MDVRKLLVALTEAVGVSGAEDGAAQVALAELRRFSPDAAMDAFGNVSARFGAWRDDRPILLLDAHIDEIGLIVTHITEDGFLKVGNCGGVDRRLLLAQQVIIHGRERLAGVICSKPPHLEKGDESKKTPEVDAIAIDTGFSREQLIKRVSPGDRVTLHTSTRTLLGDRITGKSMDDRAGVAVILRALELLDATETTFNIAVQFSTQEEVGERGAKIAAYSVSPDYAIAVDVSFAHTPDAPEHKCGKLGEGVMIGVSPTLSREMSDTLHTLAAGQGIPHQTEVMAGETSTNADVIGVTRSGAKTSTLSIPLRYMHTPVEVVSLADLEATARLIAAYAKEGFHA